MPKKINELLLCKIPVYTPGFFYFAFTIDKAIDAWDNVYKFTFCICN